MASWLYSAARRVALRARRRAARRSRARAAASGPELGGGAVSAPPTDPWPELYDELDRLPEQFRAVVVLCDLEGHSYEQAAGMLHCPVGTIQSRLARGRQRLRKRLESRGFSSAVVLVGTSAGVTARSATAAVSSQLATAIARTAVGIAGGQTIAGLVPKPVAFLVGSEIRRLLLSRSLTVLTTLVTTGLVAAAGIGLVLAGQRDDPKPGPLAATRKTDAGPIHVRVVDAQGKGVSEIPIEQIADPISTRHALSEPMPRVTRPSRATIAVIGILWSPDAAMSLVAWALVVDPNSNQPAGTPADPIVMKLLPLTHRVEGSAVDHERQTDRGGRYRAASPEPPDQRYR